MGNRPPLSPHLQVYRMPITAIASICHRVTGYMLGKIFAIAIPLFLFLLYKYPTSLESLFSYHTTWWFISCQFLLVLVLVYHGLSGLRHLVMDFGFALGKQSSAVSAWILLASSLALSSALVFI